MRFNQLRNNSSAKMLAASMSLSTLMVAGCTADKAPAAQSVAVSPRPSSAANLPETPAPSAYPEAAEKLVKPNPIVSLQKLLNNQLVPFGMPKLDTDGKAGGQTLRALCAERFFTGNVASRSPATAAELARISSSEKLSSPLPGFIISRTCQVMGVAVGGKLSMIIPVSTGAPRGYYADGQDHTTEAGRFTIGQGIYGLHNSTKYPSQHSAGNMLYSGFFNGDEAVHGSPEMAPNVTSPESHGCVRIHPRYARQIWELMGGPAEAANDSYVQLRPIPVAVM